ncbi:MAG: hypothetical protein FJX57_21040, partial [Alphaproteobacteria bacterium]|nr:hypothetical protein [Alphaproteobacteria bacterium]
MTLRDILVFLFKWKSTILGVLLVVTGAVTFLVYASPQSYQGVATVVIERNRAPIDRTVYAPGQDMVEVLNTAAAILKSRSVMEATVDRLRPHERPRNPSTIGNLVASIQGVMDDLGLITVLPLRERWIDRLLRSVRVRPVVSSTVMLIEYSDEDPEWAQKTVNAVTDAYIGHHLRVYGNKGISEFYRKQLEDVRARLESLRGEVSAIRRSAAVAAVQETQMTYLREIEGLRERLSTERTKLAEFRVVYESTHERVRVQAERIEELESLIRDTQRKMLDLEEANIRTRELQARIQLEEQTQTSLKQDFDRATISEQTNPDFVNVRLAEYSPVPTPTWSRLLLIMIAAAAGLVLGLMIAFIREYFDRRITDTDEIEAILGIRAMGS